MSPVQPGDDFEAATTVMATGDPNRFNVMLHPAWTVVGKPNGGYLVSVFVRCAMYVVQGLAPTHSTCVASSTSYAGTPDVGAAEVELTVLRSGRSITQVRGTLLQNNKRPVECSMVFGPMEAGQERLYDHIPAPTLPDRDDCIALPASSDGEFNVDILAGTDIRMDPATMDWSAGLSGIGELRGWARFEDDRVIDTLSLHYFLDCFPPATFPLGSTGWVPTLQLTNYVRAIPTAGPIKIRQRAQLVSGGYVDEVCEIWDATDQLVAQATQLALVRF